MKSLYQSILSIGLAAVSLTALTGCMDETEPTTVATEKQIQESSSATEALMMAMPSYFNKYNSSIADDGWHFPFGYGAMMYIRDLMTGDLAHSSMDYTSHFMYWHQNKWQGDGFLFCQYIWNYYYGFVLAANTTIGGVNPETATDTQLGYLGVGYAFRALVYLDLARCFEFLPNDKTSNINADGNDVLHLTVPIVKAGMSESEARNNPRATREEMAQFIEEDLDMAEQYIPYNTSTHGGTIPDLACVYGLKARLYMWLEDYAQAQKYARMAIDNARVTPMTEEDCLNVTTGFNDISKWMWGSQMTSEDDVVQSGIINWTSWLSNQTTFGYTGYGQDGLPFNLIDASMYSRISDTDFRKLEFKAPEGSPLADKVRQIPSIATKAAEIMPELAAVKFRPAEGNPDDYLKGAASAFPVMRVEEMYFIEAEAAAHQNASKGLELLRNFMTTYRDASYTTHASSVDGVVEEIVFQKRVELWGEGQTFFDIKRLNYSVTRGYPGTNFYSLARLNTNGRPAWMNFCIVQNEGNNNEALVGMGNPDPSDAYTPWVADN